MDLQVVNDPAERAVNEAKGFVQMTRDLAGWDYILLLENGHHGCVACLWKGNLNNV